MYIRQEIYAKDRSVTCSSSEQWATLREWSCECDFCWAPNKSANDNASSTEACENLQEKLEYECSGQCSMFKGLEDLITNQNGYREMSLKCLTKQYLL